jgi:hypothetical protein
MSQLLIITARDEARFALNETITLRGLHNCRQREDAGKAESLSNIRSLDSAKLQIQVSQFGARKWSSVPRIRIAFVPETGITKNKGEGRFHRAASSRDTAGAEWTVDRL